VPTYQEITNATPIKKNKKSDIPLGETDDLSHSRDDPVDGDNASLAEDDFDDIVDRFESSYNFRFEEP
jgi:protein KRI1